MAMQLVTKTNQRAMARHGCSALQRAIRTVTAHLPCSGAVDAASEQAAEHGFWPPSHGGVSSPIPGGRIGQDVAMWQELGARVQRLVWALLLTVFALLGLV